MSEPAYRIGDTVGTPQHGVGVIETIHRGTIRGRMWREVSYTVRPQQSSRAVVYYESELTSARGR